MNPNPINTILLHPTDILFFRDGRPIKGSLAGHGAAWPLPNVTDAAFHAALHRSGLNGHRHDQRVQAERGAKDNRRFGSLVTAGPFPVRKQGDQGEWFFPMPHDLLDNVLTPSLMPTLRIDSVWSSLPVPLKYPVANGLPPSKDTRAKAWLSGAAYQRYLDGFNTELRADEASNDADFGDAEAMIGIAIVPETGTTGQSEAAGKIYSAHYLRLRDDWRLGVFAKTDEKSESGERKDLIGELLQGHGQMLVGGQQRLCTATRSEVPRVPLPLGRSCHFVSHEVTTGRTSWLVKWVLLSPAIWPEIPEHRPDGEPITDRQDRRIQHHPGGWLPNWVRSTDGRVMLRSGERQHRRYGGKPARGFMDDSTEIPAWLVAAVVPKPIPVTGWALANETQRLEGGAKSLHLAVPAGAVYYFEAESPEAAQALANALNWNGGDRNPTGIRNRRSTLMGEKGFGLGVCGTWAFFGT